MASGVDPQRALSLVERPDLFPGVAVEAVPVRRYPAPLGVNAAHLLGYLGRATEAEVTSGRVGADDLVGRAGLEQQYDALQAEHQGVPSADDIAAEFEKFLAEREKKDED